MAKTQVSITYGEKTLDCELSFEPPYKLSSFCPAYVASDCEFTLESVFIVCNVRIFRRIFRCDEHEDYTHNEDITSLIQDADMWEHIEELSIKAVMERGYVC